MSIWQEWFGTHFFDQKNNIQCFLGWHFPAWSKIQKDCILISLKQKVNDFQESSQLLDHIPQTTFGTSAEVIEVAKVAKVDDAYNSTLITTIMFGVCGDIKDSKLILSTALRKML